MKPARASSGATSHLLRIGVAWASLAAACEGGSFAAWLSPAAAVPSAGAPPAPAFATGDQAATAASLLNAADAAIEAAIDPAGEETARALYERLVREFPVAPEAVQARRALRIMAAQDRVAATRVPDGTNAKARDTGAPGVAAATVPAGSRTASAPPPRGGTDQSSPRDEGISERSRARDDVVLRQEPYSTRTSERLRLTTWEKLDFGVTSFLYGLSVGASYALGIQPNNASAATLPIAIGALAYTVGAVAFLRTADPDRGDLPLALAITSYVPTTVLLVSNIASTSPDAKKTSLLVAAAGVFSVPIAIAAAQKLELDPGDTQLVRDAGFWGLVLGTTGMLAFGGSTTSFGVGGGYEYYQAPTARGIATAGLLGLYGGLGLGILAATNSEVSLERVRVTTWGGYGGALLGALVGGGAGSSEQSTYRGLSIGALVGLVVTFVSTGGLDGIPPDEAVGSSASSRRFAPTMVPIADVDGQAHPGVGIAGVWP